MITRLYAKNKEEPAVLNMEVFEQFPGCAGLCGSVRKGLEDIQSGNTRLFSDALNDQGKEKKEL